MQAGAIGEISYGFLYAVVGQKGRSCADHHPTSGEPLGHETGITQPSNADSDIKTICQQVNVAVA
jgi:hypothetical protein